ncbi:hypothetical protein PR202_gb02470 [Eleusine coracana subsp. coracana]|uniref:ABC transporter domain-containing protein n=1 Tax=Eleusine coracana subsp. coracana TaxID=191504 RepID=A0AAV5DXU7_ELECO|nr:hypothetical protein PR202_gb02470 [Eleusine coracana subsp. coracana]
MEYREKQPVPAAAVELACGEDLWWSSSADVATTTTAGRREPPPLTHEDNRGFLQMLREKKQRLGVEAAKVEVAFERLTVEADVRVGRRAVPTLLNCAINAAQIKGKVMYNGQAMTSSTPHYLRAYVSQYDLHHPEMTVRETIDFSSKMLGTSNQLEMLGEAIRRKKGAINKVDQDLDSFIKATTFGEGNNLTTNYIIKILGLSECADTLVGDELRRGISGGQKKRATIGEMLVGLARCFFMDDISTGLDSSTTFEIMKFLQQMAHLMDLTMVISLLQPPPETLELFDDIILLCEGEIVYHGPRENATGFFETMGFKCPSRKNVADFLQEVTSKMDQKQYWAGDENKYQYHSIEKFSESFRTSYLPQLVGDKLCSPSDTGKNKEEFHYNNANTVGEAILKIRGQLTQWHWYWICVSILFGYSVAFNILSIFALEFMNSPHKHQVNIKAAKGNLEYSCQMVGNGSASTDQAILPFRPLSLVFDHINYFVDMPKEMTKNGVTEKKLQLLQDVSGAFRPGVLTALMGITGAGKTTLLDVLAGRKTGGYTEGTVKIAGYPKKQETFSRISGYCEQSDIHSPNLTVYESLKFSAWLRLPSNVKPHQRDMFIEEVMSLVELTDLRNAMVGIPGATGLSAEQRKRLTIAVELVASPSIIFMDEPTTGLDARAAAIVMRTVRNTVDTGRTVVCTIHQPSIEIFESFDELLLMKRGGQLIYSGSLGPLSSSMIKYFEAIPGVPRINKGQNPAAWMLDISSHTTEYEIGINYAEVYRNSSLYRYTPHIVCYYKAIKLGGNNISHDQIRSNLDFVCNSKDAQDVFNVLGVVYGSALFLGFMNCSILQPVVAMERVVLYREKAAGMYSTMAYAIAQVSIELPYMFVQVLMFSAIVYPMIGFQLTAAKFFWFVMYMVMGFMYYTLLGMMTVALTPNIEIAMGLSFLIFIFWNVFSGFILAREMIPVWWRWVYWADPAAWTVYGLMFSQLGDRTELIRVPGLGEQTVREFLEAYLGLQDRYFELVTCLHLAVIALFAFLFFLAIKHLKFQRR